MIRVCMPAALLAVAIGVSAAHAQEPQLSHEQAIEQQRLATEATRRARAQEEQQSLRAGGGRCGCRSGAGRTGCNASRAAAGGMGACPEQPRAQVLVEAGGYCGSVHLQGRGQSGPGWQRPIGTGRPEFWPCGARQIGVAGSPESQPVADTIRAGSVCAGAGDQLLPIPGKLWHRSLATRGASGFAHPALCAGIRSSVASPARRIAIWQRVTPACACERSTTNCPPAFSAMARSYSIMR